MSAPSQKQRSEIRSMMSGGVDLHGQGRLEEAAIVYRQVLAQNPQDFDATQLLGVVALQQGKYELAQRLMSAAIAISPHDPAVLGNLGVSYMSDGHPASALEWFLVALKLQPNSVSSLLNVGTALQKLDRQREALPFLRRALGMDPNHFDVCIRLGECLLTTGELREAADVFELATIARPQAVSGWTKLSDAWESLGDNERARECLRRMRQVPQPLESEPNTLTTIDSPALPSAHVFQQTAYAFLPNGFNADAIRQLERALEIEPINLTTRLVMAIAHLQSIYANSSSITASRELFSRSIKEVAVWYAQHSHEVKDPYRALGVLQPFCLAYHPFNNREILMAYGKLCAELIATLAADVAVRDNEAAVGRGDSGPAGRIRVGIASPHIKEHSVWNAITKGWVDNIDRTRFEIYLFQLNHDSDSETERVRSLVTRVFDAPTNVVDWSKAIAGAELDVLIYPSVGMDPLTQQLASLRLAPVQAVTWGHPETTGFPTVDLYLSAKYLESQSADEHYSERLVRLPNLGVYVEPLAPPREEIDLRELGLPDDEPLLLCPGTPFKYSPLFDDVWITIAKGLRKQIFRKSRGRLVFFRSRIATMDGALEARLRAAFAEAGVDFDANVSIIPTLDRPRYFALMRRSALLLDTLGFSGFNTAIQGVECDLPVLAFEGEFMRGRLASCLLRKLNLPELVATSKQQFIETALDLVRHEGKREALRVAIAARKETLFRDITAVRALENCLTEEVRRIREAPPA